MNYSLRAGRLSMVLMLCNKGNNYQIEQVPDIDKADSQDNSESKSKEKSKDRFKFFRKKTI